MDMKTDTPADDADAVIAEVFRLTGTCLTRDDPVMAVLLMQRQMFQTAFAGFAEQQAEQRLEFLKQLAAHERKITAPPAASPPGQPPAFPFSSSPSESLEKERKMMIGTKRATSSASREYSDFYSRSPAFQPRQGKHISEK